MGWFVIIQIAANQVRRGSFVSWKIVPTLIEKPGRQAGQKIGRSPWLQTVIIDEKAGGIGDIINVRITEAGFNSLHAEPA